MQSNSSPSAVDEKGELVSGVVESVSRGGLNLNGGPRYSVPSLFHLIGVRIPYVNETGKLIESPWLSDPQEISSYFPDLAEKLSVDSKPYIEGRVNVNEADMAVLLGLPGMTEDEANRIVQSRARIEIGDSENEKVNGCETIAWLYTEKLVSLQQMRTLAPYATTAGDVFRIQVLGYFDRKSPTCRLEAVIDATKKPSRIVFQRDLTHLGLGYLRHSY